MSYKQFRLRLAKQMKVLHNERLRQLDKVDSLPISEKLKKEVNVQIFGEFDKKIEKIKNRPRYEKARKLHLDQIRKEMMTEKEQSIIYTDDGSANYNIIPKKDAKIAAEVYGEGYKPLEDFLRVCFENEIRTFGCCSGHPEIGALTSYVYFDGSNEKVKRLVEFIIENNLADEIGMDIGDVNGKKCAKLSVFLDVAKRNTFYRCCTEQLKEIIKEDNLEDNFLVDKLITILEQYKMGTQAILDVQKNRFTIYLDEPKEFSINDILQN